MEFIYCLSHPGVGSMMAEIYYFFQIFILEYFKPTGTLQAQYSEHLYTLDIDLPTVSTCWNFCNLVQI